MFLSCQKLDEIGLGLLYIKCCRDHFITIRFFSSTKSTRIYFIYYIWQYDSPYCKSHGGQGEAKEKEANEHVSVWGSPYWHSHISLIAIYICNADTLYKVGLGLTDLPTLSLVLLDHYNVRLSNMLSKKHLMKIFQNVDNFENLWKTTLLSLLL